MYLGNTFFNCNDKKDTLISPMYNIMYNLNFRNISESSN